MNKPLGWIVVGQHGWPQMDGSGRVLIFPTEDSAKVEADMLPNGRYYEAVRWKSSPKRRHEHGPT